MLFLATALHALLPPHLRHWIGWVPGLEQVAAKRVRLEQLAGLIVWLWVKIKRPCFTFTRVPFGVPLFDPRPFYHDQSHPQWRVKGKQPHLLTLITPSQNNDPSFEQLAVGEK